MTLCLIRFDTNPSFSLIRKDTCVSVAHAEELLRFSGQLQGQGIFVTCGAVEEEKVGEKVGGLFTNLALWTDL